MSLSTLELESIHSAISMIVSIIVILIKISFWNEFENSIISNIFVITMNLKIYNLLFFYKYNPITIMLNFIIKNQPSRMCFF